MHFLVSPAKALDFATPGAQAESTWPVFSDDAAVLIGHLRELSAEQLGELMDLSPALSELNVARYRDWQGRRDSRRSKSAMWAFNGDVYEGLQASTLTPPQVAWAQQHVSILSGLYGVLRPLDAIEAHRLEMGTPLRTAHAATLYGFWGSRVAELLRERVAADEAPVVVNLASQEYFKVVRRAALQARVIDCVFEDWKAGRYKVISFWAKRARGLMLRFAIERTISTPEELTDFAVEGYAFDAAESSPDRLVFRRRHET